MLGDLDLAAVQALAEQLPQARAVCADVSLPRDAERLAQTAETAFGKIDILINNAGIGVNTPFMDTTPDDLDRTMRINLGGAMLCSQAALRRMIPAGYGRIVNVSSVSGQRGSTGRTAYGASKAALDLMTKVMTVELAQHGISINAVAPGAAETEMAATLHDAATRRTFTGRTPDGRYATPEEIASACVFLASDAAAHINGQVIAVDGGLVATGIMVR